MMRFLLPLLCAVLGLAAASCSQPDEPLAPTADAPASAPAPSHDAAIVAMATSPEASSQSADTNPSPDAPTGTAVERRASTLIGLPVVAADGTSLGEVKDIIFDPRGRATHLVITYTTDAQAAPEDIPEGGQAAPGTGGKLTAMPWDAAMASIRNGQLVLDGATLQGAPSFTPDAWPNLDDPSWSATTDAYWRKAVRAAIEANPGAPVDSTARRRGRPPRDGG